MKTCLISSALLALIMMFLGFFEIEQRVELPSTLPEAEPPETSLTFPVDGSANPYQVDVSTMDDDTANALGWEFFLSINQPAGSSPSPVLWQTWMPSTDVYLPCGVRPAAEVSAVPEDVLAAAEAAGLEAAFYTYLPFTTEIDGRDLTDTNNDLVRFEVRLNPSTVQTVVNTGFYNRDTQVAFFGSSNPPLQFESDALEVKATWRIMQPGEDTSRFFTTTGYYYENGQPVIFTAGLTGLHITSKILPDWLWITFEQVDNQQTTHAPMIAPIPPDVQALNDQVHSQLPANSVWRYYNLRGTQWAFKEDMSDPTLLANTQIETYFQESSSCITCHFIANIGSEQDGRLFYFEFVNGNQQGYIGDPSELVFYNAEDEAISWNGQDGFIDDSGRLRYRQLDFVWSLREAQPTCSN